jgi:hypothetical protein
MRLPRKRGRLATISAPARPPSPGAAQHVLPRGDGLVEDLGVDLLVEPIVAADVTVVGLRALAVAKMLSQREEAAAVAQRGKPGEGLAPLMRRQPPGLVEVRQAERGAEAPQQMADARGRRDLQQFGLHLVPLPRAVATAQAQPQFRASREGAMRLGQRLEHRDRLDGHGRCDPFMGTAIVAGAGA